MDKRKVQSIIFICNQENEKQFLLLQMNERRKFFWQNVTGSVDDGEDFEAAALREAVEETKLTPDNIERIIPTTIEYKFTDQWQKNVTEKVFFIQCKNIWDVVLDPSEHVSFKWVDQNEIKKDSVHFESNYQALVKAIEYEC